MKNKAKTGSEKGAHDHLQSNCPITCKGDCDEAVKLGPNKRWFITMGHPGFNAETNNGEGYGGYFAAKAIMRELARRAARVAREKEKINRIAAAAAPRIKNRYLSIKNEGQEIYCENLTQEGDLKNASLSLLAINRLQLIRRAMPEGTWTITIEQELQHPNPDQVGPGAGGFQVYNPETGEVRS